MERVELGVRWPKHSREEWQVRNAWRSEGLSRFIGLRFPLELSTDRTPLPAHKMLFDLPSYCYDQHTRAGLRTIARMVKGVSGGEPIRDFFRKHQLRNPQKALGEAIFFVEGGRIESELIYPQLQDLENRVYAQQLGFSTEAYRELRTLTREALQAGILDRVRAEVLYECYGQSLEMAGWEMPYQQNLFGGRS
jgi:hypothetical protein